MNEKDFYKRFIELCLRCDTYTKKGVKEHNKAVVELSRLFHDISDSSLYAEEIYSELMDHNDERVKSTAAAHSLALGINISKAKRTLFYIAKNSKEPLNRFNAEMTLEVWEKQGYLHF